MIFQKTNLQGAWVIDLNRLGDERGFFARSFCQKEFMQHGMSSRIAQCNVSYNIKKHTLRGMHWQLSPFPEAKTVQCTQGSIYDVIIDLRLNSPTFGGHLGLTLSAEEHRMLYIPEGFAHGFLTLEDQTQVLYLMSEFYAPEYARGFRWNDPFFNVFWPVEAEVISEKDAGYPDFSTNLLELGK